MLPELLIPQVPFTLETLRIIAPYALGMALVGLMESLMTAKLVDDITDTHSTKTREGWGQGVKPSTLRRMPHSENIGMFVTVIVTVLTSNLAIGVLVGVNVAIIVFARVARFAKVQRIDGEGGPVYKVTGELFFATSNDLVYQFDYAGDPGHVTIDLSESHVWDASTVATLDAIESKYGRYGKSVEIVGLNASSAARHQRLSGQLGAH